MTEFYILWNTEYNFFYMEPGEPLFVVFTDAGKCLTMPKNGTLKRFCYPESDLYTFLYNNGFSVGYIDGKTIQIKSEKVAYLARNVNNLCYVQYKMTKDKTWLDKMDSNKLWTFCQLEDELVFSTITNAQTKETLILVFTDKEKIPQEALDKYGEFQLIRYPFDSPCLVNMDVARSA